MSGRFAADLGSSYEAALFVIRSKSDQKYSLRAPACSRIRASGECAGTAACPPGEPFR